MKMYNEKRTMKKDLVVFFSLLFSLFFLLFIACEEPEAENTSTIPVASDFNISGLEQVYNGNRRAVSITPKEGKSTGKITIYYWRGKTSSTTAPINVGNYKITFDVDETDKWNAAVGLDGGTLKITPDPNDLNTDYFGQIGIIEADYIPNLKLEDLPLPDNFAWKEGGTSLNVGDNQSFPAAYTDSWGRPLIEGNIVVNVNRTDPVINWPGSALYFQTLADILPGDNGDGTPGTFAWAQPGDTPVGDVGTHKFVITFTPEDTVNYLPDTREIEITVTFFNDADILETWLKAQPGGTSVSTPVTVKCGFAFDNMRDLPSENDDWYRLLAALENTKKYVDLDLSGSSCESAIFNPGFEISEGKKYIVSVTLPDSATTIGAGNSYLEFDVVNNNPVTITIYESSFKHFTSLEKIIGKNIVEIQEYAFYNFTNLKEIAFSKAANISRGAFYGCSNLTFKSENLLGTGNLTVEESGKALVRNGTELVIFMNASGNITGDYTAIGNGAFYGCSGLTSVSFLKATGIGSGAFNGCTALVTANIPKVTRIESDTFAGCTKLEKLDISDVTRIDSAFYQCEAVESIKIGAGIPAEDIENAVENHFSNDRFQSARIIAFRTFYFGTGNKPADGTVITYEWVAGRWTKP